MVVCELGAKTKLVAGMATLTGKPSWARDLRPVGLNYFGGIVTNVDEVLEEHRRETRCSFGTRSSKLNKVGPVSSCSHQQPENSPSTLPTNQQKEKENDTDSTDKENKNPNKVYTHDHNTRTLFNLNIHAYIK